MEDRREREGQKDKKEDIIVMEIYTYEETRMESLNERERERESEASRGSGRKWPIQGGWNHLGFHYIEQ